MEKKNWINVFILGTGFLLVFSAFQTTSFLQTLTIAGYLAPSCNKDNPHTFGILSEDLANRVGYYSGAIIYFMVAVGNWASVSIVAVFGPKWSLVVSGALYVVYIAALIRPLIYTVFIGAFILGAGGGVLWTAQGQILIQNSSKEKMGVTTGIFWFMLQTSLVAGSIYVTLYFYFSRNDEVALQCFDKTQNMILFGVLTIVAVCGIIVLMFLRPVTKTSVEEEANNSYSVNRSKTTRNGEKQNLLTSSRSSVLSRGTASNRQFPVAIQAIVDAFKMMITTDMILLIFTFVYTGYELNYWAGVFGTVVGRTGSLQKFNVGIALFFIGLGEISGGALFGVFGSYTNRYGREPIVLLGFLCHIVCYLLSYLFLPDAAILHTIDPGDSYGALGVYGIMSNPFVPAFIAFILGFGDACYNTQIYSIIGVLYSTDEKSAPAMALYKFFQSMAAMVGFFTSAYVLLKYQLIALVILAVIATMTFAVVEWRHYTSNLRRVESLTNSYEEPYNSVASGSTIDAEDRGFEETDSGAY